jgi:hypothetical protein
LASRSSRTYAETATHPTTEASMQASPCCPHGRVCPADVGKAPGSLHLRKHRTEAG